MRINLNPSAMPEPDRTTQAASGAKPDDMIQKVPPNAVGVPPNPVDVAQLSSSQAVGQLKSGLDAVADVRQTKVEALRQAMAVGTYQISPQRIAGAMLAEAERKLG